MKPKFNKINLTQKDLPIMTMILFCELVGISVDEMLKKKRRYTTKWRQFQDFLIPITDKLHTLGSFLDYCFQNSGSLRENDMNHAKYQIAQVIMILENLDNPKVADKLTEASKIAENANNVKITEG